MVYFGRSRTWGEGGWQAAWDAAVRPRSLAAGAARPMHTDIRAALARYTGEGTAGQCVATSSRDDTEGPGAAVPDAAPALLPLPPRLAEIVQSRSSRVQSQPAPPPLSPLPSSVPPADPAAAPKYERPTLLTLVQAWTKNDSDGLRGSLYLGMLADRWVRLQPERPAAVQALRRALAAAGFAGETLRVNRYIACYWVARLFDLKTENQVTATALRALLPLIKRIPRIEKWKIRERTREQALALWARLVSDRLSAAAVARAVAGLRPPRKSAPHRRKKSAKIRVLRGLSQLSADDLSEVIRCCQQRLQVLGRAA